MLDDDFYCDEDARDPSFLQNETSLAVRPAPKDNDGPSIEDHLITCAKRCKRGDTPLDHIIPSVAVGRR